MRKAKDNGFWRLGHDQLTALLHRRDLCWQEVRVLLALADRTIAYGNLADIVSLSQIQESTGMDRRHIWHVLNTLKEKGLYGEWAGEGQAVVRWVIWPSPTSESQCASELQDTSESQYTSTGELQHTHQEGKKGRKKREGRKHTSTRFTPPTPEDVSDYAGSIGFALDGHHFVDHYTANGWMVGKNRMKDWQAAVRTWQRRDQGSTGSHKPSSSLGASPNDPTWDPSPEEAEALLGGGKP